MVRHALTQVASPAKEPVSLAEAKLHLKIEATDTAEDKLIERLIVAARRRAEVSTGRALVTQTWTLALDGFPGGVIEVPRPPLSSVASITYIDPEGATQTVAADRYRVDAQREPGRLTPAWDESWPPTRPVSNAVEVHFVAGYGTPDKVHEDLRQALLLIVGRYYAHREDVQAGGTPPVKMPFGAEHLLLPYRLVRV